MQGNSQKLKDVHEQTSNNWSFGSNNHQYSQSRKISIGVMADSLPKRTFLASKEDDTAHLDTERVRTTLTSPSQGIGNVEEMTATKQPKPTEAEAANSPWIATKSIYRKEITSQGVRFPERKLNFSASGRGKGDEAKTRRLSYLDHPLSKEASVLQLDDDKMSKFSGVTYERKRRKDKTSENIQEFTFATFQDVLTPDKEAIKNKENIADGGRTVSLRMKLQEILGTVSPPNDQYSKSPTHELGTKVSDPEQDLDKMGNTVAKPRESEQKSDLRGDVLSESRRSCGKEKQKSDQMGDPLLKPRQNSDTIETDSDCPDHRVERPVTRSLTRKRAPTKVQKKTTKTGRSTGGNPNCQDKSVSHEDGFLRGLHATVDGSSSMSVKKKTEKKFRVKPLNLFDERFMPKKSNERDTPAKIPQVTHRCETLGPAQSLGALGKTTDSHSRDHISNNERQRPLAKENSTESNIHSSPLRSKRDNLFDFEIPEKTDQQKDIDTPPVTPEENFGCLSGRNFVNQPDGLQSPTLGVNTPASSSSLDLMLKADLTRKVSGSKSPLRKNSDCYGDTRSESSDDEQKQKDSLIRKASSSMKEREASQPEASFGDRQLGSSEEDSPTSDEFYRRKASGALFRGTNTVKKQKFMPHPANRPRRHEINVQLNHTDTLSPSSKGNGESNWISRSSEKNQVDGLTRVLELLALELEKIKSKIKAVTSKKSSEIMMSVVEDVHRQLKNAESHIQTDMGKLTNISKLKRKRVETRFEEQQERLQSIYVKFKEQINQHLQDCKSTYEGLRVEQMEFKEIMEKRKKSHGKLLLQAEEAIEILLNDAQRRITATHESARGKMLQLKQVLALCLKEDISS